MLEDFEQNMELLKKLLSEAMTVCLVIHFSLYYFIQVEQWKLLFRANGHDYDPQYNYRIQDLIDFKILQIENQDVFNQIHKQATREQKLKDKLVHMQTWLSDLHYRMAKYRPALKISPRKFQFLIELKFFFLKFLVQNRLTSSYRQRLSRYRELRSRTSTAHKTPSEIILATEASSEVAEEAYIMINSQEILRLIEV